MTWRENPKEFSTKEKKYPENLKSVPPQEQIAAVVSNSPEKREYLSKLLNAVNESFEMPKVRSNQELVERYRDYLIFTEKKRIMPTVEGLMTFCGYSVYQLRRWVSGQVSGFPDTDKYGTTREIAERIKGIFASIDADLVMRGSVPQVPYIFRAKSVYDYVEKQEIEVVSSGAYGSDNTLSPEEIAKRLPEYLEENEPDRLEGD